MIQIEAGGENQFCKTKPSLEWTQKYITIIVNFKRQDKYWDGNAVILISESVFFLIKILVTHMYYCI